MPDSNCRRRFRVGVLKELLERDGPFCRYCGTQAKRFGWRRDVHGRLRAWVDGLEIEHIRPRARGGTNELTNLTLACEFCNRRKGTGPAPPLLAPQPTVLPEPILANVVRDDYDPQRWAL